MFRQRDEVEVRMVDATATSGALPSAVLNGQRKPETPNPLFHQVNEVQQILPLIRSQLGHSLAMEVGQDE
jgi:hypothetical protein